MPNLNYQNNIKSAQKKQKKNLIFQFHLYSSPRPVTSTTLDKVWLLAVPPNRVLWLYTAAELAKETDFYSFPIKRLNGIRELIWHRVRLASTNHESLAEPNAANERQCAMFQHRTLFGFLICTETHTRSCQIAWTIAMHSARSGELWSLPVSGDCARPNVSLRTIASRFRLGSAKLASQ